MFFNFLLYLLFITENSPGCTHNLYPASFISFIVFYKVILIFVFQKVTQCLKQCTELPRRTPEELEFALKVIDEALQISSYSEQLLQMKADTLLMVCITVN